MASNVISIVLSKKDNDLKRWIELIDNFNLDRGFYIRQAILAYINDESIVVGTVLRTQIDRSITICYSVSPTDVEICKLIDILKRKKIKISPFLKNIIRKYIRMAQNEDEENIPDYLEFDNLYSDISIDIRNELKNELKKDSVTKFDNSNSNNINTEIKQLEPTKTKNSANIVEPELKSNKTEILIDNDKNKTSSKVNTGLNPLIFSQLCKN